MDAVAKEVQSFGRRATVFLADVTSRDQVYTAVDHAEKELGGFDIMVNNAGIAQVQPLAEVTPQAWGRFEKNLNLDGREFSSQEERGNI